MSTRDMIVCDSRQTFPINMDGVTTMSSNTDKILTFLMSNLPAEDLAELDGMLDGGSEEPMAADARIGSVADRKAWMRMGPRARNAARAAKRGAFDQRASSSTGFAERYANASRIRVL